jgi:hypothetical protein
MISVVSKAEMGKRMNAERGRRPSIGRRLAIVAVLAVPFAILSSGAHAAPMSFLRTNVSTPNLTGFVPYATLSDLATGSSPGTTLAFSPLIPTSSYLFFDGVSYYKTVANSGLGSGTNQIVQYGSYQDLATNTSGTTFNLQSGGSQQNWSLTDDFFADGLGNYYRNNSPSSSVAQYPSFTDLVNNTNGSGSSYQSGGSGVTWGADNRFFGYEGTFYRTDTNGSGVTGFVMYGSYADLLSDTRLGTTTSTVSWSASDQFIAVPEPSAWALGLCGMVPYLCWASRRSREKKTSEKNGRLFGEECRSVLPAGGDPPGTRRSGKQ